MILLVEDDESVRLLMGIVLSRAGYRVLDCSSGPAAQLIWTRHRASIRLLISDIVMLPGMNGADLARLFLAEQPGLKVILMSGYHSEATEARASFGPEVGFILKPFSRDELLAAVRSQLNSDEMKPV